MTDHWPFMHSYQIVASTQVTTLPDGIFTIDEAKEAEKAGFFKERTRILLRCDCGKVKSEIVDGRWSLAQLTEAKP